MDTTTKSPGLRKYARKEFTLLVVFLFFGFVLLPIIIYKVGQTVFGEFGGAGYVEFFGTLSGKIRSGDPVAWFLILSPYLAWQSLRLMIFAWRRTTKSGSD